MFFNIMYQKFVGNGGGASIFHFKFSPASVVIASCYTQYPGIYGSEDIPRMILGITLLNGTPLLLYYIITAYLVCPAF